MAEFDSRSRAVAGSRPPAAVRRTPLGWLARESVSVLRDRATPPGHPGGVGLCLCGTPYTSNPVRKNLPMLVAWTSRSDIWNETGASHVPRHVLRQASRTAVKDNQGRRQHALPRRHGHDRTTSWPDSPRGSLTAPLAASGVLPIWPLPIWAFCISRCQSACSSPTAHGSSCTCVAESITHATYNRLESVPGPHSVRQSVYEKNGLKWEVATCNK